MATTDRRRMTLEAFLELPDEKPALELEPDGTVVRKVSPKGVHSTLQWYFLETINGFALRQRLAKAYPELRTIFSRAAYVPDVSVYRWERIPRQVALSMAFEGEPVEVSWLQTLHRPVALPATPKQPAGS